MNTKFLAGALIAANLLTLGAMASDDEARAIVANPASPVIEQMAELNLPFIKEEAGSYEPDYDRCIVNNYEEGEILLNQLANKLMYIKEQKLPIELDSLVKSYSRLALYVRSSDDANNNRYVTTAFCKLAALIIQEKE